MIVVFLYPLGDGAGLGQLEPWHAEEFAAAVAHARDHLAPWIPFAHTVTDVDSARQLLQRLANDHASDSRHFYGIWLDGRIVGGAVFPMFDTRNAMCELGVWLVPEVQGRGLISRAAAYLIDWAIGVRGMRRVGWNVDPRNERSKAVARRLGMTFEGVRRSSHVLAGERQDEELWSVLADEWKAESATAQGGNGTHAAAALIADGPLSRPVAFFDATYGNFDTRVQAAVRRGAFGEDLGQNSWLTADEWRRYLAWLGLTETSRLLDVASGSGGPAVCAAVETGCRVVGVDAHRRGVEAGARIAAQRGVSDTVRFVEADASSRLPFDDDSFDAVTCIDSIHHFPDRASVLAEWRRVLRPGGQILYTDPIMVTGMLSNHEIALRSSIGDFLFTPGGINERLLAAAGFDIVRCDDTTENMEVVAHRWRLTRVEHCRDLMALEGDSTFDGQQRFLQMTSELAAGRRLSRYTFHAIGQAPSLLAGT